MKTATSSGLLMVSPQTVTIISTKPVKIFATVTADPLIIKDEDTKQDFILLIAQLRGMSLAASEYVKNPNDKSAGIKASNIVKKVKKREFP